MKNPREGEVAYEFCGKIFKYLILPYGKSKRWAASGELESDSAIRFQTGRNLSMK